MAEVITYELDLVLPDLSSPISDFQALRDLCDALAPSILEVGSAFELASGAMSSLDASPLTSVATAGDEAATSLADLSSTASTADMSMADLSTTTSSTSDGLMEVASSSGEASSNLASVGDSAHESAGGFEHASSTAGEFHQKLAETTAEALNFGPALQQVNGFLGTFSEETESASERAVMLGAGIGVVGAALQAISWETFDAGLGKAHIMAETVNMDTQSFLGLQTAMASVGVTNDSWVRGMMVGNVSLDRYNQELAEGKEPTDRFAQAIQKLGLETTNADGSFKGMDQVLPQLADHLKEEKEHAESLGQTFNAGAELADIFGRRMGPLMAPLLLQGSGPLTEYTQKVKDFGLANEEELAALERTHQAQAELALSTQAVGTALGSNLAPAFHEVATAATSVVESFIKLPQPVQEMATLAPLAVGAFAGMAAILPKVGEGLQSAFTLSLKAGDALIGLDKAATVAAEGLRTATASEIALAVASSAALPIMGALAIGAVALGAGYLVYADNAKKAADAQASLESRQNTLKTSVDMLKESTGGYEAGMTMLGTRMGALRDQEDELIRKANLQSYATKEETAAQGDASAALSTNRAEQAALAGVLTETTQKVQEQNRAHDNLVATLGPEAAALHELFTASGTAAGGLDALKTQSFAAEDIIRNLGSSAADASVQLDKLMSRPTQEMAAATLEIDRQKAAVADLRTQVVALDDPEQRYAESMAEAFDKTRIAGSSTKELETRYEALQTAEEKLTPAQRANIEALAGMITSTEHAITVGEAGMTSKRAEQQVIKDQIASWQQLGLTEAEQADRFAELAKKYGQGAVDMATDTTKTVDTAGTGAEGAATAAATSVDTITASINARFVQMLADTKTTSSEIGGAVTSGIDAADGPASASAAALADATATGYINEMRAQIGAIAAVNAQAAEAGRAAFAKTIESSSPAKVYADLAHYSALGYLDQMTTIEEDAIAAANAKAGAEGTKALHLAAQTTHAAHQTATNAAAEKAAVDMGAAFVDGFKGDRANALAEFGRDGQALAVALTTSMIDGTASSAQGVSHAVEDVILRAETAGVSDWREAGDHLADTFYTAMVSRGTEGEAQAVQMAQQTMQALSRETSEATFWAEWSKKASDTATSINVTIDKTFESITKSNEKWIADTDAAWQHLADSRGLAVLQQRVTDAVTNAQTSISDRNTDTSRNRQDQGTNTSRVETLSDREQQLEDQTADYKLAHEKALAAIKASNQTTGKDAAIKAENDKYAAELQGLADGQERWLRDFNLRVDRQNSQTALQRRDQDTDRTQALADANTIATTKLDAETNLGIDKGTQEDAALKQQLKDIDKRHTDEVTGFNDALTTNMTTLEAARDTFWTTEGEKLGLWKTQNLDTLYDVANEKAAEGVSDYTDAPYQTWADSFDTLLDGMLADSQAILANIQAAGGVGGAPQAGSPSVGSSGIPGDPGASTKGGISALASGTSDFGGGWTMVGEQGPELVNLPSHSAVYPSGTAPSGGGPGSLDDATVAAIGAAVAAGVAAAIRQAPLMATVSNSAIARGYQDGQAMNRW